MHLGLAAVAAVSSISAVTLATAPAAQADTGICGNYWADGAANNSGSPCTLVRSVNRYQLSSSGGQVYESFGPWVGRGFTSYQAKCWVYLVSYNYQRS